MKLNGNSMVEINPGSPQINRAKKQIYKEGTWKVKTTAGTIIIPCSISYSTKEELVSKLNSIEVYLQNGWLYIDNYKYNVKLIAGLSGELSFDNFKVVFQTDEFAYEVYNYVSRTAYITNYNPLSSYNFVGTMDSVNQDLAEIEIDGASDNFITGEFSCIDMTVYASFIPQDFTLNGIEIERRYDASI